MKVQVVKVHLMGSDLVIDATENQAKKLTMMNNDSEKRNLMIKIGRFSFRPCSVSYMVDTTAEEYDVPKYYLEAREREQKLLGE